MSYFWDYGDGNTGTGPVVTHQYNSVGPFLACLVISDSLAGCYDTYCDSVGGNGNPINCLADFSYTVSGNTVNFTNQSTGLFATYAWDFGDGNASTATDPTHTYVNSGSYVVCLTMTVATGGARIQTRRRRVPRLRNPRTAKAVRLSSRARGRGNWGCRLSSGSRLSQRRLSTFGSSASRTQAA